MDNLEGQVAVVTGGGRGIGAGISARLAALGATVVITGRQLDTLEHTASKLRQTSRRVEAIACDVRHLPSVEALAAEAMGADCVLVAGGHQSRERLAGTGAVVLGGIEELLNL